MPAGRGRGRRQAVVRTLRFLAVVSAAGLLAWGASLVPGLLAGLPFFQVDVVEVEGARYLEVADAVQAMAVPSEASVWDDPAPWEEGLRRHPLVRDVRVRRRLPSTLVAEVVEREPVALIATPMLEPVDREGRFLPIDPVVHRLDLPLLEVPDAPMGEGAGPERGGAGRGDRSDSMDGRYVMADEGTESWNGRAGTAGRGAVPLDPDAGSLPVRLLASEVVRLGEIDRSFLGMVSSLEWVRQDEVAVRWGDPEVLIRFRPPLAPRRLREAITVLSHASATRPDRTIQAVDLRYEDQVVVRFSRER